MSDQHKWKGDLLDLVEGRTDGPVKLPASALRDLGAAGASGDWVARRDPGRPGCAECNGVLELGGGFRVRWGDLRRLAAGGASADDRGGET